MSGKPLPGTPPDLDAAAAITPEDIARARAAWRAAAPATYRALLDAITVNPRTAAPESGGGTPDA